MAGSAAESRRRRRFGRAAGRQQCRERAAVRACSRTVAVAPRARENRQRLGALAGDRGDAAIGGTGAVAAGERRRRASAAPCSGRDGQREAA